MAIADAYVDLHVEGDSVDAEVQETLRKSGPGADKEADRVGRSAGDKMGNSFGKSLSKILLKGTMWTSLGIASAGAIPQVLSLAGSLAEVAKVGALLPAVAGAAAAGVATLVVGMKGFGKTLKDMGDPKKFAADLKNLAPSAAAAALAIKSVGPAWGKLQDLVQQNLFAGLANQIRTLSAVYIPMLKKGMGDLATSMSAGFNTFANSLKNVQVVSGLAQVFQGAAKSTQPLFAGLGQITRALATVAGVGAGFLPALSRGFAGLATQFNTFIAGAAKSGALTQFIQAGLVATKQLWDILVNVGKVLWDIIKAAQTAGGGTLATLSTTLAGVAAVVGSPAFQTGLTAFFAGLMAGTKGVMTALPAVGQLLADLGPVVGMLASTFGPILGTALIAVAQILRSLVPPLGILITALATGLKPVIDVLAATLPGLADVLGPVLGLAIQAVSDALVALMPSLVTVVETLMPAFAAVLNALVPALPALGAALSALTASLGPIIVMIAQGLANAIITVAPILGTIVTILAELLTALAPVIGPIVALVVGFKAVSAVIGFLGPLFKGLAVAWQILSLAFELSPIGLVIVGLVALGAALVLAYQHSETFRNIVNGAWTAIQAVIGTVVSWITGTVVPAFIAAWDWIKNGATGLWTAISGAFSAVVGAVTGFVTTVVGAIMGFVATLISIGLQILNVVTMPWRVGIALIIGAVMLLWNTLAPLFAAGVNIIMSHLSALWNRIVAGFNAINGFIMSIWNTIWAFIANIVNRIVASVMAAFNLVRSIITTALNTINSIIMTVWNAIWSFISGILNRIRSIVSAGFNALVALVSGPVNRIAGVVSTAFSAAVTAISGFIGRARTAAASVGKAIIDAVTGFVGRMAGIGGDIVQGLINGITGMAGALAGAISSFISNNVPGPIRKLLHLGSPSKLTEQFGKWTTEGLINGLVADASGVRGAAALLAKNAASGFGLNLPAVSMAGGAPSMAASSGPTAVGNMGSSAATTTYGNVNITISVDDLDKMSKVSDFIDRLNGARMNQRRQVGSVNG